MFVRLSQLRKIIKEEVEKPKYPSNLFPPDHLFGANVGENGAKCVRCKFISRDQKHCENNYFHNWQRMMNQEIGLIPEDPNEYCCDVYKENKKL